MGKVIWFMRLLVAVTERNREYMRLQETRLV